MTAVGHFADSEGLRQSHDKTVQSTVTTLAGALAGGASIEDVLANLISASLALVSRADCAKVSVLDNGRLRSIAVTSELTTALDNAQEAARHGPCLDAISAHRAVRCNDLRTDARWPQFACHATTAGVHSVQSSPIGVPGATGATLSLFAFQAEAFGAESEAVGAMLANHAAIALINEKTEREFKTALASRDIIGQAKGMIMERFGVDARRAFAMLRAISQETNTPVRELAAKFVDSGKHRQRVSSPAASRHTARHE
jgi:transcriptional regulator with GAF, ATPase, and Fis domain